MTQVNVAFLLEGLGWLARLTDKASISAMKSPIGEAVETFAGDSGFYVRASDHVVFTPEIDSELDSLNAEWLDLGEEVLFGGVREDSSVIALARRARDLLARIESIP